MESQASPPVRVELARPQKRLRETAPTLPPVALLLKARGSINTVDLGWVTACGTFSFKSSFYKHSPRTGRAGVCAGAVAFLVHPVDAFHRSYSRKTSIFLFF